jgi:hypothetical protein
VCKHSCGLQSFTRVNTFNKQVVSNKSNAPGARLLVVDVANVRRADHTRVGRHSRPDPVFR